VVLQREVRRVHRGLLAWEHNGNNGARRIPSRPVDGHPASFAKAKNWRYPRTLGTDVQGTLQLVSRISLKAGLFCHPSLTNPVAMAQRPVWRGHLRLALVSCPVALYNARHDRASIRFNLINPKTGHRIRMVTIDGETGEELERRDLVKGFEFKKDHYVLLSDEDFDSVKVESSEVMNIEKFVDASSIDPMYYDASYFLAADGQAGEDVYAVLREAIAETGKVALARVVISQRERTIALRPLGDGMMAQTLYEQRDMNSSKDLFEDTSKLKPDAEMVALAKQLIQRQSGNYDPADLEDRYETRLRAMLDAKIKGEGFHEEAAPADRGNVIDLMAALKKSLGQTVAAEPTPKKAAPAKKAASGKSASPPQAAKGSRKRA
jgi:DNA end-binding protein Ku